MLSSRVLHKKLPLKDIESRPKFIVLTGRLFYSYNISNMFPFMKLPYKWRIQFIRGFKDIYYKCLQVVNMYALLPFWTSNALNDDS